MAGLVIRLAPLPTLRRARLATSADRDAWAYSWRSRSREVVTLRPPCSTVLIPYFSMSKSLTKRAK